MHQTELVANVRVLIVDDHEVFADALSRTLTGEMGIEVVGTAPTGEAAVRAADDSIDVLLCDFRLPDIDGVEVARRVLAEHPSVAVVMLTASTDDSVLVAAIEAGCAGFVSKSSPLAEVVEAVLAAANGESVISPALLRRLLPRVARRGALVGDELSPRELDVLREMARGLSNQAIADVLVVSRDTVRNHVASILRKLDAHSKLEAVAIAARRDLIHLGPEA